MILVVIILLSQVPGAKTVTPRTLTLIQVQPFRSSKILPRLKYQ